MSILLKKIKKIDTKKSLAIVILAGLSAGLLSAAGVGAVGPQFNIFPISYTGAQNNDLPLIDAKNITQNGVYSVSPTDHQNGVSVNPGDKIAVSIYYHNGVPDTDGNVALNAIVRAFASPSLGSSSNTHTLSATVGAQNASTVSSSDPARGGDIGVSVSGTVPQALSLVPGTTKLYFNWGSKNPANGASDISQIISLPDSVFTSGVNIGNIRGCWQYSGFVNFELQVGNTQPVGDLAIKKEVRNVTQNGSFNDFEVSANPSDQVEYRVTVSALNNPVSGVAVRDVLDTRLPMPTSITVDGSLTSTGSFFQNSGYSLGTVGISQSRVITFKTTIPTSSALPEGTYVFNNTATAFTVDKNVSDGASVRVVVGPAPVQQMSLNKLAKNDNTGGSYTDLANADPTQTVSFQLQVSPQASNTAIQNVMVRDSMPTGAKLSFVNSSLMVNGTNRSSESSAFFSSGINIGTLNPGQTITVDFKVLVAGASQFAIGCEDLINTAYTNAGSLNSSDTATVRVCVQEPTKQPGNPGTRPN